MDRQDHVASAGGRAPSRKGAVAGADSRICPAVRWDRGHGGRGYRQRPWHPGHCGERSVPPRQPGARRWRAPKARGGDTARGRSGHRRAAACHGRRSGSAPRPRVRVPPVGRGHPVLSRVRSGPARADLPASIGAGSGMVQRGGPGTVRRGRRTRPARPVHPDVLGDRGRTHHRRARLRVAGRPGRLLRDQRRDGRGARGARRQGDHRRAGRLPRRARPGRRRHARCRTPHRRPHRRCAHARPHLPCARPVSSRAGRVQGRPRGRGRVPWRHEPSRHAGTVHLAGGYEEVALA
jgi:hypothetical protein